MPTLVSNRTVSFAVLLSMMDPSVHENIARAVENSDSTHVALFENLDMSSSHLGERTVLCVGPNNTYKTVADLDGSHLYDLPSMRKYPTMVASTRDTHAYEVIVGNIGSVCQTDNPYVAAHDFLAYVDRAVAENKRHGYSEEVSLWCDCEPVREHAATGCLAGPFDLDDGYLIDGPGN